MTASKEYRAELGHWPNGSYGLIVTEASAHPEILDPVAEWSVRTTAKGKVPALLIAHLVGHDTTHAVWRVR